MSDTDRERQRSLVVILMLALLLSCAAAWRGERAAPPRPLLLAHYMPWYSAPPTAATWGWHWTMGRFDPEVIVDGRRAIASRLYPLEGPYDSGDVALLEQQLLLMKLAGIDGVIVDWYGRADFRDHARLHRHTTLLVEQVQRLGMRFAICYEDATIPALVTAGRVTAERRVEYATAELTWLAEHWFGLDAYVSLDGTPVLLSFGHDGLTDDEWRRCLQQLPRPVAWFGEHRRRAGAVGAFDWPQPRVGVAGVEQFARASRSWAHAIPVVFPRFVDVYAEAGVHASWGHIDDDDGRTFRDTLQRALGTSPRIVQLATWNDWGEGTVVEPSVDYGYRDLEHLRHVRGLDSDGAHPDDLLLPAQLLALRRADGAAARRSKLDAIAAQLARGDLRGARDALRALRR